MHDFEEEVRYWRAARKKRGLSLNRLAKALSEKTGTEITLDQLSGWEYRRTQNPTVNTWRAIEQQLREWRREDSLAQETAGTYGTNYLCPVCHAVVPGPDAGARFCMFCGQYFAVKLCKNCGLAEHREDARYCVGCGSEF